MKTINDKTVFIKGDVADTSSYMTMLEWNVNPVKRYSVKRN